MNENTEHSFSFIHLKIRRISNKFDALTKNTSNNKFKVIGITETWVNDDNANDFGLEGHNYVGRGKQITQKRRGNKK